MTDNVTLIELSMLSNPAMKVHDRDTFKIKKANDHLTWYKAQGRDTLLTVKYINQFESTGVAIGSTQYLLVPAQKLPHAPAERLDHYKAYQIVNPLTIVAKPSLQHQFDELMGTMEFLDSLRQIFFLTPAVKNTEQVYDTVRAGICKIERGGKEGPP